MQRSKYPPAPDNSDPSKLNENSSSHSGSLSTSSDFPEMFTTQAKIRRAKLLADLKAGHSALSEKALASLADRSLPEN